MLDTLPSPSRLEGLLLSDEPMCHHTTYRIGGPADRFCQPANLKDLRSAICHARKEGSPFFIMGNGSNLLVSDAGYRGLVIQISRVFNGIHFEGSRVVAGAGTDLNTLLNVAARRGLFGLPFAVGIPGTVAGAVAMNAGSATRYMGQHIVEIQALNVQDLKLHRLFPEDLHFQYRRSAVEEEHWVILQVTLQLEEEDPVAIFTRIRELLLRRKEVQPLAYPSAGSVFRNPGPNYAGKLIEESGCKGWREGEAMVSPVHANFLVNCGHATASEVFRLMIRVQRQVQDHFGITLEPEVRILGDCPEELRR